MAIKKEIEISGVKYFYVNPDDFTFDQQAVGKKIARKVMTVLQKTGEMDNLKFDADGKPIESEETKITFDSNKIMSIINASEELEESFNELDIISLCYSKESGFSKNAYRSLKEELAKQKATLIDELRECIPDFFTYIMPRTTVSILTSMGSMTQSKNEDEKNTENIAEVKET